MTRLHVTKRRLFISAVVFVAAFAAITLWVGETDAWRGVIHGPYALYWEKNQPAKTEGRLMGLFIATVAGLITIFVQRRDFWAILRAGLSTLGGGLIGLAILSQVIYDSLYDYHHSHCEPQVCIFWGTTIGAIAGAAIYVVFLLGRSRMSNSQARNRRPWQQGDLDADARKA